MLKQVVEIITVLSRVNSLNISSIIKLCTINSPLLAFCRTALHVTLRGKTQQSSTLPLQTDEME
jgi:hypothetical protein